MSIPSENLASSPHTAEFWAFLCTHNINFENHRLAFSDVNNSMHISDPYKHIGFISWSKICRHSDGLRLDCTSKPCSYYKL